MRLARLLSPFHRLLRASPRADTPGVMFAYARRSPCAKAACRLIQERRRIGDQIHTGVESYLQIRFTTGA